MSDEPAAFEFSTAGAKTMADDTLRLTIDIAPKDAAAAFNCFGQRGIVGAIALLNPSAAGPSNSAAGDSSSAAGENASPHWSSRLYKLGWWLSLDVLKVLGPEKDYAEWVRGQPCANCHMGGRSYPDPHPPSNPIEYAHVRRAGQAGTGYKPPYRAIPLCCDCHSLQHQKGESALCIDCDQTLGNYLSRWGHARLREHLGVESLTEVTPEDFAEWLNANDLGHTFHIGA